MATSDCISAAALVKLARASWLSLSIRSGSASALRKPRLYSTVHSMSESAKPFSKSLNDPDERIELPGISENQDTCKKDKGS